MLPDPSQPAASVYRPAPEPPSPRWARASRRLGLAARATWAAFAVDLFASALTTWARARMRSGRFSEAAPYLTAAHAAHLLAHLATTAVWIGACASLAALPRWLGARGAARAAWAMAAFEIIEPFIGWALAMTVSRSLSGATSASVYYAAVSVTSAIVHTVYALLVATAVERAATALDRGRPVRLVPWALFASALAFGSIVSGVFTSLGGLLGVWFLLVPFVVHGALSAMWAWGWARGLRTASAVLGAQTWPESHRGGPDAAMGP